MSKLAFARATELAALIRQREVSARELLEMYIERLAKYDDNGVNAVVGRDLERARADAAAIDAATAAGGELGPLHGVPMTVKESFDVAGLRTTWGVPQFRDNVAATDSVAVSRLRRAGAVVFGKTNVPMWCADDQAFNEVYGVTNNPWNPELVPGGSSGGSAAALAAGLTAGELGSDIASSIRGPASYCGVYGHKSTWGVCPGRGHALNGALAARDIAVVGPMARSAADIELIFDAIAGPDEIEAGAFRLDLLQPHQERLSDFKVGVMWDDAIAPVDTEVLEVLARLETFLAGEQVTMDDRTRPVDMEEVRQVFTLILRAITSARLTDAEFAAVRDRADDLAADDQSIEALVVRGNAASFRDWQVWDERRWKMRWQWQEYFKDHDVLLAPAFPVPAHPHIHDRGLMERSYTVNGVEYPMFNQLMWAGYGGLSLLPALAAPVGFTAGGLPVGVQIIAPFGGDHVAMRFAQLLEREYHSFVAPPGFE